MLALGLVETKGLVGAIEGADAMLKAAEVRLLEKNLAGGGLVTITIAGEVSAVRASVDAAVAAIGRVRGASLVSGHVIARPDGELERILSLRPGDPGAAKAAPAAAGGKAEAPKKAFASEPEEKVGSAAEPSVPKNEEPRYSAAQLKKMSLSRLRQIAGELKGMPLSPEKVASTDRKALIDAVIQACKA